MKIDLAKMARGQDCMFRIEGHCAPGPENETVVFCHDRRFSKGGMGYKGKQVGAFGCHNCHAIVDGRMRVEASPDTLDWYWNRAKSEMIIFILEFIEGH